MPIRPDTIHVSCRFEWFCFRFKRKCQLWRGFGRWRWLWFWTLMPTCVSGRLFQAGKRMQLSHLTVQWHENKSSCGGFRKQMWISIKSIKNPLDDLYGLPLYLYDCMWICHDLMPNNALISQDFPRPCDNALSVIEVARRRASWKNEYHWNPWKSKRNGMEFMEYGNLNISNVGKN